MNGILGWKLVCILFFGIHTVVSSSFITGMAIVQRWVIPLMCQKSVILFKKFNLNTIQFILWSLPFVIVVFNIIPTFFNATWTNFFGILEYEDVTSKDTKTRLSVMLGSELKLWKCHQYFISDGIFLRILVIENFVEVICWCTNAAY